MNGPSAVPETQVVPEDSAGGAHPCLKCGQPVDMDAQGIVIKHGEITCSKCQSIYQMVYRHLGGLPDGVKHLSAERQMEFFKNTGALLQTCPKNGRWSLVKSSIVGQMISMRTEQVRCRISQEFLPMSVWQARGFDTELIEAKGTSKEDSVLRLSCCSSLIQFVFLST